jgi:hypothetical protein
MGCDLHKLAVGGTGIEPVTSSVSGKRSPAELTAREAEAGIEPLGHSATGRLEGSAWVLRAARTCLAACTRTRDSSGTSERTTGFEPATLTLAR